MQKNITFKSSTNRQCTVGHILTYFTSYIAVFSCPTLQWTSLVCAHSHGGFYYVWHLSSFHCFIKTNSLHISKSYAFLSARVTTPEICLNIFWAIIYILDILWDAVGGRSSYIKLVIFITSFQIKINVISLNIMETLKNKKCI